MKKYFIQAAILSVALTLNSCGNPANTASQSAPTGQAENNGAQIGSVLGSILGSVIGNTNITQKDLVNTWIYKSSDCKFESDNFLKQAGGEIAAATIENKLNELFSKVGIVEGNSGFTFNDDGTYYLIMGEQTLNGTYTYDETTGKIELTGTFGLLQTDAVIMRNSSDNISILFDAEKLLKLTTAIGSKIGNNTVQTISNLLNSYDGAKVGMELSRK